MFVIRREQMDAMDDARLGGFRAWAVDHLREHFPEWAAGRDEAALLEAVRGAISRARAHGAESEASYCIWLDLSVALGEDFDTAHPWAAAVLADRAIRTPDARIDALSYRALEYLRMAAADGGGGEA